MDKKTWLIIRRGLVTLLEEIQHGIKEVDKQLGVLDKAPVTEIVHTTPSRRSVHTEEQAKERRRAYQRKYRALQKSKLKKEGKR